MDFSRFMDGIVSFAHNHTVIVIVLALVLLYLMVRKPKVFIGILALGLFPGGIALFHHEHFPFGLGAGKETDSRRGKAARY